jgi:hypothetical protein
MTEINLIEDGVLRPEPVTRAGFWGGDFALGGGRVQVRDTGADLKLDATLLGEVAVWMGYHVLVRARSWAVGLTRRDAPKIWFEPCRPRPWYLVWSAMAWAGLRFARSAQEADACFAFEDSTWSQPTGAQTLNGGLTDISKSRVADVFEQAFGYPLTLDPLTWTCEAVEKGEVNGAHDGRVVHCPMSPRPGCTYQRLIDTARDGVTHDLRTACVGGAPVAVWIKTKPAADRFSIHNLSVTLHDPADVFTAEELAAIGRFLALMGADWAGLDILRDRDGRLYVVDVNKTDVGPIIALTLVDKLRSTAILARALEAMVGSASRRS